MMMGERVAQRMRDNGLSQSELARRVGISQQAVGKLIHGDSRKTAHIGRLARELNTTTAYLEGETDDPTADAPAAPSLDSEQRELVDHFGGLAPADRRALLQIARSMAAGAAPAESTHSPRYEFKARERQP